MDFREILDWVAANPAATSALVGGFALAVAVLEKVFGLFSRLFGWARKDAKKSPTSQSRISNVAGGQVVQAGAVSGSLQVVQGVDPEKLVDRLLAERERAAKAEARADELESERAGLLLAVEALRTRAEAGQEADRVAAAFAGLEDNAPAAAEAIFRDILEDKKQAVGAARREAAAAARHLGALTFLHDTEAALAAYEEAVELDPQDPAGLNNLAEVYKRLGRLDEAERTFERLLQSDAPLYDADMLRGIALGNLGRIAQTRGDTERAIELQLQSLKLNRAAGQAALVAANLGNLGTLLYDKGDYDRAEEIIRQSLALDSELGNEAETADDFSNLGLIYKERGDLEQSQEMFEQALAIDRKYGNREGEATSLFNLGDLALIRRSLEQAVDLLERSLSLNESLGHKEGSADALLRLGDIAEARGALDDARAKWVAARDLYREMGLSKPVAEVEESLARAAAGEAAGPDA